MYVVLTAFLYQRGSSESKPLNEPAPQDQDPREATANHSTPWPVRSGGWVLALYEHSLAIAFFRVVLRLVGRFTPWVGLKAFNEEQLQPWRGGDFGVALCDYVAVLVSSPMQNWQSEVHCGRGHSGGCQFSCGQRGFRGVQAGR